MERNKKMIFALFLHVVATGNYLVWVDRHVPCFYREEKVTLRHPVDVERSFSNISFSDL